MLKVLDRAREDAVATADGFGVALDEVAREGARRMLAAALEAEVEQYIEAEADASDAVGSPRAPRASGRQRRDATCRRDTPLWCARLTGEG